MSLRQTCSYGRTYTDLLIFKFAPMKLAYGMRHLPRSHQIDPDPLAPGYTSEVPHQSTNTPL